MSYHHFPEDCTSTMRRISYKMDGFCILYLLLILLMRSGDIETNPGPNTALRSVSEMEFLKLAQDIPPSYYEAVGISLGIPYGHLQAILCAKLMNCTNALLDVFMKWNDMQQHPHSNKRQLLADVLREIDLPGLSDRLLNGPPLPNSTGGPLRLLESQSKPPSAGAQTKPLSPELVKQDAKDFKSSSVSEMEFLKLAWDIDPSYYYNVGISLGFSHAQLKANLIENLKNFKDAFMDVFMKWNVLQQPPHSNKRQLLADKLREIGLEGLSDRLLNESPFPNYSTGGPSRMLESQTKPLSPELVERCAKDFKFKYRSTVCKIRADPLNPASSVQLRDMYTNLVLLKEHGPEKQMLDYKDILNLKVNGEFPKRIMVQGEAGAGKTTFCAKIAWDWIEGRHFSHFVWVLIVPLREFKQHTIGEIAKSYLSKNNPATVSQITDYIRSNPDKVFIAFDGLDEVSSKIMKTESCESQPTDQMQLQLSQPSVNSSEAYGSSSETGDIGLGDILCSVELASCPVLVTTRPWRAVEIRSDVKLMKRYTFIRVEGFNRENLSLYIHKYFPENDDKANQLIQFITSENDFISEYMAHYPIYVAMLCLMWKELDKQTLKEMKSLKSFSQIFREMIAILKEHYVQKEVKKLGSPSLIAHLKEIDELLRPVAKQALNGLLENTLTFSEDDFQICPESKETACRVGILSQDKITPSMDIHKGNSYVQLPVFFPHRLFQDLMAGIHLASLYDSDPNEFYRLIEEVVLPRKEEFRYLLYFTVSQNKSIATYIMNSMLQGIYMNRGASQKQIDFIVDVAFESQNPDVAALVKDRVSSKAVTLTISRDMTAHTAAGYAFIGPDVDDLYIKRDCGPTMSLDVAEMICTMPSLKEAFLQGAFHHCFFASLARKGKESKVQTLKLEDVQFPTPASSHHLAEALCSMPNLTDLTLRMDLNQEFYSTLKAMASSIQVQTLKLEDVQCPTPASSHHLSKAVCSMPNLTDLTLGMDLNEQFYSTLKANAPSIKLTQIHTKTKWLLPEETLSMSVNEPSGCEATPSRTETRDIQQKTEEIHAQYEFQAEGRGGRDMATTRTTAEAQAAGVSTLLQIDLESDVQYLRRTLPPSDHPQQQPKGDVHYPRRTLPPSDHPQQQPMCDVQYLRRTLPPSDHPQQQPMGDVHSPRRTLLPSDHPQQQPMGDVHYPRRTLPPSDHPQQQAMGDVCDPRRTLAPSDHPQQQPMGDVHYSRRTLPSSDHPQQHVGITSDTVFQISQTYRKGSSIWSRPYKRQAPRSQSRAPQDDPEIPEEQSKIDLESDKILNTLSKHMPPGIYATLCTQLGIGYTEANFFLTRFNMDYQRATRHCLAQWKTKTGGNMAQLKTILVAAGVTNLVKYVK